VIPNPGQHRYDEAVIHHVEFVQWIPVPLEQVFLFFANPGNLPKISPPQSRAQLIHVRIVPPPGISRESATVSSREPLAGVGSEIVTSFRLTPFLPIRRRWTAQITEFQWNHHFADVQKSGPFKYFHHRHEFSAENRGGQTGAAIRDVIEYQVGFGALGEIADKFLVRRQLADMFSYRQKAVEKLLVTKRSGVQFLSPD
jgi:ligand-binding SRPBCC domain-containing protein